MKKITKKIVAVLIAFAIGITIVPMEDIGAYAVANKDVDEVATEANRQQNALSTLEDTLNGKGTNSDSNFYTGGEYAYTSEIINVDVDIEKRTMTVDWYGEASQIVVEFYEEDYDGENNAGEKLIAKKTQNVVSASDVVHTDISYSGDNNVPNYFVLKIYMLDSSGKTASMEFLSNSYTEEIYKLRNMTEADYNVSEDRIIKVSDVVGSNEAGVKDDSFMVLNDETVLIKEENRGADSLGDMQVNVFLSDEDSGQVDIELSNMPSGLKNSIDDIEKGTPVFVIDQSTEGTQTTTNFYMVTALNLELEGNDGLLSANKIQPASGDTTGYSALKNIFKGVHIDKSVPYTVNMADIPTGTPCQLEAELDGTVHFKFDFSITAKNAMAITFANEMECLDALLKYTTPSIGVDIPIREIPIGIPGVAELDIGLKLRLWGDAEADLRFDFGLYSGIEIGVGYGGSFVNNKCQSPSFAYRGVNIGGEVFVGFAYGVALSVGGGAVSVGGDLESGVIFTGQLSNGHYYDGEKKYHSCDNFKCVTGDVSVKLLGYSFGVSAKIFSKGLSGDILPPIKLTDWYYSGTYKDSAATLCPHWGYRLYVHVVNQNGEDVPGAYVYYENDDNQYESLKSDKTDITGMAKLYMPVGEYKIKVSAEDNTGHTFNTTVDFKEEGCNEEGELYVLQKDISIDMSSHQLSFTDTDQSGKAEDMPEPVYAYHDQPTVQIPDVTPKKSGRVFLGWAEDPDSSEVDYEPGDPIKLEQDTPLFAVWAYSQYTVKFDKNQPGNASNSIAGDMRDQKIDYDGSVFVIDENKYSLTGWVFDGWNTKPNGTGDSYEDKDNINIKDITQETLTLYAQWEPKVYTVTFKSEEHGDSYSQNIYYDTPTQLNACTFAKEDSVFTHWSTPALGSSYADKAKVTNLCTIDENGNLQGYTLTANWLETTGATIIITDNGQMVDTNNAGENITLRSIDGTSSFSDIFEKKEAGVYSIKENSEQLIPPGTYQVVFEGDLAGYDTDDRAIDVEHSSGVYNFAYCTVSISADEHAESWVGSEGTAQKDKVLIGTELEIGTNVDKGYHFEGYTAVGNAPGFYKDDPTIAEQTITVTGEVDINAHPAANLYKVVFHINDGNHNWIIKQDMVYDEPQNLFSNPFERLGYEFSGWTETQEWVGKEYTDALSVENLTSENNGEFDLYAQWTPVTTYIEYHANGGEGQMSDTKTFFEFETTLKKCEFTRDYWNFIGWNTKEDGTGIDYPDEATFVSKNTEKDTVLHLYAQWDMEKYKIDYDLDGGVVSEGNPAVYTVGTEDFTLNKPVKPGYIFLGWTGSNGEDPQREVTITKGSHGDKNYRANWKPEVKTVIFDPNGGQWNDGGEEAVIKKEDYGSIIKLPEAPSRQYYDFALWQDSNGNKYAPGYTYKVAQNLEFKALWNPIQYAITYDLAGGIVKKEKNPSVYTAESDEFTLVEPERDGYIFIGWTGSNGKDPERKVTITKGSGGDRHYTANWKPEVKTVIFDPNGGQWNDGGEEAVIKKEDYGSIIKLPEAPSRQYYDFALWQDSNGNKYAPGYAYKVAQNLEFKALWNPIQYAITYDLAGGTVKKEKNPSVYTAESDEFTLVEPERDGYIFIGWTGSNGEDPERKVTITKGSGGDRYYTANWKSVNEAAALTGDNMSIGWVLLMFASLAGIIAILRRIKGTKENGNNK